MLVTYKLIILVLKNNLHGGQHSRLVMCIFYQSMSEYFCHCVCCKLPQFDSSLLADYMLIFVEEYEEK